MTKINSQNSHEAIQMWWCVSEVSALLGEMGGVTRRTAWGLSSWLVWSTRYSAETRGSRPEEGKKRAPRLLKVVHYLMCAVAHICNTHTHTQFPRLKLSVVKNIPILGYHHHHPSSHLSEVKLFRSSWQLESYSQSLWIYFYIPHTDGVVLWVHLLFCDWLISFSILSPRFIHLVACVRSSLLIALNYIIIMLLENAGI